MCHAPCSLLSACAWHHADKPCQADAPRSRSLPNTFPPHPRLQGKKALPTPPHRSILCGTLRPTGSNIFGNITLELGGLDRWAAPRAGTEPPGEGPRPRDPAAIALLFRSSVTRLAQGRGNHGPGEAAGPHRGVCTWAGGGERSSFLDPVCFPV